MSDLRDGVEVVHAFSSGAEGWELLPLCWEGAGECPPPDGMGLVLSPVALDVTCGACLEWLHA